ncbi:MAG: hypothetical protein AAFY65_14320 [Pseudomonadota bacterium]
MSLIPLPYRPDIWRTGAFPAPWPQTSDAIYETLAALQARGANYAVVALPDEGDAVRDRGMSFVAGAADNLFLDPDMDRAVDLASATLDCLRRPTAEKIADFYALVMQHPVTSTLDDVLPRVAAANPARDRVLPFFTWLATSAPDREPVKFAIAMLGLCKEPNSLDLIRTLGGHEEFTKCAAVAMGSILGEKLAWRDWWALAKSVRGWGRIDLVERIAPLGDANFRRWLVRDGFQNSIMNEYLAHIAAVDGDLLGQLRAPDALSDRPRLRGASQIFIALVSGGPTQDMYDYDDGAEAALIWLDLAAQRPTCEQRGLAAHKLTRFAARDDCPWPAKQREAVQTKAAAYLARADLKAVVETALMDGTPKECWSATQIAQAVGLDAWPYLMARQEKDPTARCWYDLMQTRDRTRVAMVVDLAERQLDLDAITTGAASEMGVGPKFQVHMSLDFVVQDLRHHPGLGWTLIEAALQSPVVRNRNMAAQALAAWPKGAWPDGAVPALRAAIRIEPEETTRQAMENALTPDL